MSEEVTATWATRELLILRCALRRLDGGELLVELEDVRQETELPTDQLWAGVQALTQTRRTQVSLAGGWTDDHASGVIEGVSERARRELGSWPSADDLVTQLAAALSQAADREAEPERKGRLRAAADTLGGIAREIAVQVISRRLGQEL